MSSRDAPGFQVFFPSKLVERVQDRREPGVYCLMLDERSGPNPKHLSVKPGDFSNYLVELDQWILGGLGVHVGYLLSIWGLVVLQFRTAGADCDIWQEEFH